MEPNTEWSKSSLWLLENPDSLEAWEELIRSAENNKKKGIYKSTPPDEIEVLRVSYNKFLERYPLLFNYWVKYANWEFKLGNLIEAESIYKRALYHLSYSLDIWIKYLTFKVHTITDNLTQVLDLFETARSKIGKHFHAYEFYQLYLQFLEDHSYHDPHKFRLRIWVLYRQIIEIPLYHYEYFFKKFIDKIQALSKLPVSEFRIAIRSIIPSKELHRFLKLDPKAAVGIIKKTFMDVFIATQFKVYEMFTFEKNITRPYYDVKYLSQQQLDNWDMYIDFFKLKQYPEDYVTLAFERCLIATASYPNFWIKYANFSIASRQYLKTTEVLMRGFAFNNHYQLLLKLVDVNMVLENNLRAKDLLTSYLQTNVSAPAPVYEKVICIERILNPGNLDHLLAVIREVITETNNAWFLEYMLLFECIPHKEKVDFLNSFENLKDSPHYKTAYKALCEGGALDFNAEFDAEINSYL